MRTVARLLAGRRAVVVGASRGIGRAVARELAGAGASLALVARSAHALAEAAAETGATALPADVSSPEQVDRLAREVARRFGGAPDLLVNAAGAFGIAPLEETETKAFDEMLAVNLRGPFLLLRAFLPGMRARGSGHLVNVGSVAGRVAFAGNAAYGASKFGLRGLHEVLVEEIRGTGLRATLVEPAATDTPLWDPLDPDRRPDLPPRAAMLRPDDVARSVLFAATQPAGVEISLLALRSTF